LTERLLCLRNLDLSEGNQISSLAGVTFAGTIG
jgi:hypothetical protein